MAEPTALSEWSGGHLDTSQLPGMWASLQSHINATPDALALACTHQPPGLFGIPDLVPDGSDAPPYLRWSFRSVHDGVDRLIRGLRSLGAGEDSLLITFVQNGAEYILFIWAAVRMGCTIMPISPRNLTNTDEAIHMIKTGLGVAGKQNPYVLAGDAEIARGIDGLDILQGSTKILVSTETAVPPPPGWIPFQSLMDGPRDSSGPPGADRPPVSDGGVVLFTSGTTSLPKGMYHGHANNPTVALCSRGPPGGRGVLGPGSVLCCSMPTNHAMGWMCTTWSMMSGASLIVAGAAFDPAVVLDKLFRERATLTVLVPAMIHALAAAKVASPEYSSRPLDHVESVMLGGSSLTSEHVKLATDTLGLPGFENLFGCTEGFFTASGWTSDIATIAGGHDMSVGQPLPGFAVRIVDPETGDIVPRNVLGELHGSGSSMIRPYIGGVGKDAWYTENGVLWYKSGDQARMDDEGRLFITGRYKEMIIRGGENISPVAVEAVLSKNPLINPLAPQIVGKSDEIAGEVPVAVIKGKATPSIRSAIQSEIVKHMGALYVPQDVISIEDLGLADYPRTVSNKVQKVKLAALVNKYLSEEDSINVHGAKDEQQLAEEIRTIWARAVGLDPSQIRLDASFSEFADSITMMRVRDRIQRQTGKALSLAAMTAAGTIANQVKILQAMEPPEIKNQESRARRRGRLGPPEVDDMVHLTEDPDLFPPTQDVVSKMLAEHGLTWHQVDDIIPAYDLNCLLLRTGIYTSWSWDISLQPAVKVNKMQLRRVLEAVVMNNRILASFIVWDPETLGCDDALHVVLKQSDQVYDLLFEDGGELDTLEALKDFTENHPRPDWISFPGPCYRAILFDIKETGGAALVLSVNHSVVDASVMQAVQDDLDRALAAVNESSTTATILSSLNTHVDYKVWADSYYNLRTSAEARAATKRHVERLKQMPEHVRAGALFPSDAPRSVRGGTRSKGPGPLPFSFDTPDIQRMREQYPNITPTAVAKAAVALMNVHRTGHTHAVFASVEAARTYFPFLTKTMLEQGEDTRQFEATDVSGPTYQMVCNVVEVDRRRSETVVDFLEQVQEEEIALRRDASAPVKEIMKGLDEISPGAGDLVPRVIETQNFNWVPGLGTTGTETHQQVRTVKTATWPTTGMMIHVGLGGKENQTFYMNILGDGASIGKKEAAEVGAQLAAIIKWLATAMNWMLPVADFEDCLHGL